MKRNTQKIKTKDGYEIENGEPIWYISGDTIHMAALRIGHHDQQYYIYKSKTNALDSNPKIRAAYEQGKKYYEEKAKQIQKQNDENSTN